jgi:hypothetical protein
VNYRRFSAPGKSILTTYVPVAYMVWYAVVLRGARQIHNNGHFRGGALKFETFLGPEMATSVASAIWPKKIAHQLKWPDNTFNDTAARNMSPSVCFIITANYRPEGEISIVADLDSFLQFFSSWPKIHYIKMILHIERVSRECKE